MDSVQPCACDINDGDLDVPGLKREYSAESKMALASQRRRGEARAFALLRARGSGSCTRLGFVASFAKRFDEALDGSCRGVVLNQHFAVA